MLRYALHHGRPEEREADLAQGWLFLLGGILASGALILEHWELRTTALLILSIWCFARFYYFAFYVIERYVDPQFKFAGLWSFFWYVMKRRS